MSAWPVATQIVPATDGVPLAVHETGPADGVPVLLIHGLFSSAAVNWIKYGHAARLAAVGRRVIMPDLRAHGESGRPHDPSAFPADVLVDDALAVIGACGLADRPFALGGYSLGGRTVVRLLAGGLRPAKAIVAGMGLDGLLDPERRAALFRHVLDAAGTHPRGSPAFMAEAFLRSTGGDPRALRPLLDSFVATRPAEIAAIPTPCLVLIGDGDQDNGSAADLAALLPAGELHTIPGNHMSVVATPALGAAIADWLARPLEAAE